MLDLHDKPLNAKLELKDEVKPEDLEAFAQMMYNMTSAYISQFNYLIQRIRELEQSLSNIVNISEDD